MPNNDAVKKSLIEIIRNIQRDSGYEEKPVLGTTCPVTDLEGFDSKIWPVAIGMLASALQVDIPNDKNIFLSSDGKRHLTVDEATAAVCKAVNRKE